MGCARRVIVVEMRRSDLRLSIWIAAAGLLVAALPMHAAEHITLRNGFELDCSAREVVGDRVRLYTGAGTADYLEVSPDSIARAETIISASGERVESGALPAHASPANAAPREVEAAPAREARVMDIGVLASRAGQAHHIDADLLSSIIRAESGGNARAVSRAGARGLMQLMPATATALGVGDSFVPEQNVAGGAAYLDQLLTMFHDNLVLAVAAYNAGPAAVMRYHGVPPYRETREYVTRVVREFNRRKLAAK